jgi:hypothetical protein
VLEALVDKLDEDRCADVLDSASTKVACPRSSLSLLVL